jgi:DNA-binding transcriptional LysR family regulator
MDLHYLKIFYEVAKEKSFTKASNNLFINQSAVSIQIRKFEDILNIKLFDRSSKKIKLTYAGEVLFKTAEGIFQSVKRAEKEINKIVQFEKGKIVIGATHIIGEPLLPKILKEFSSKYEGIDFEVYIQDRDILLSWLKEGKIDIALMGDFYIREKNIEVIPINEYPFVIINRDKINSISELENINLIARNDSRLLEKNLAELEKHHNINITKRITVNGSIEAIKKMVMEGIGFSIQPYYCVYEEIKKGKVNVVYDFKEERDGYQAVITTDKKDSDEIVKFISLLKSNKIEF